MLHQEQYRLHAFVARTEGTHITADRDGNIFPCDEQVKKFTELVSGGIIIVEREYFEKNILNKRALIDKLLVVISDQRILSAEMIYPHVHWVENASQAHTKARSLQTQTLEEFSVPRRIVVIGGAKLYNEMMRHVTHIHLTEYLVGGDLGEDIAANRRDFKHDFEFSEDEFVELALDNLNTSLKTFNESGNGIHGAHYRYLVRKQYVYRLDR